MTSFAEENGLPEGMFASNEATRQNRVLVFDDMANEVRENNIAKGWHDEPRTFGDDIALLHSELSEALEAYREHGIMTVQRADGKPEGVGSELADVLVRLLDTCGRYDIDLVSEYEAKMAFNRSRPYRHGGKAL